MNLPVRLQLQIWKGHEFPSAPIRSKTAGQRTGGRERCHSIRH